MWGGWLLVTGLVLSFASGIIHPYYTVALAPAIAALVGIGVVELWRERGNEVARCLLAVRHRGRHLVDVRAARPDRLEHAGCAGWCCSAAPARWRSR